MSRPVSACWERLKIDTPAEYALRADGHVAEELVPRLGGLEIGQGNNDQTTLLVGRLIDQAALLGALRTLVHAGYALQSIECLGPLNDAEPVADE